MAFAAKYRCDRRLFFSQILARRFSFPRQHINRLFLITYITGLLGSRVAAILVEERPIVSITDLISRAVQLGPMMLYGGLLLSTFFVLLYCWTSRINPTEILDILVPPAILGIAIGRLGCFLNGDDYGIVIRPDPNGHLPWWAVVFPNHQIPVPRLPIQLVESLICFGLVGLCLILLNSKKVVSPLHQKGRVGLICLALYAEARFFIEYGRGDLRTWSQSSFFLSPAQMISIFIILLCNFLIFKLGKTYETKNVDRSI